MPFITFGTNLDSDAEKNVKSGGAAVLALFFAGGAMLLGRSRSTAGWSKFSEDWPEREETSQLPRESMSEVVFEKRR